MALLQLIFNWKTILAGGAVVTAIILARKVEPSDACKAFEAETEAVSNVLANANEMVA